MYTRYKILMLIPELGYGGAERSFMRLSQLLSQYHDVTLVVFRRDSVNLSHSKAYDDVRLPLEVLDDNQIHNKLFRWMKRWCKLRELKKKSDITISFLTGASLLNVMTFSKSRTIVSLRGSRLFDPAFFGLKLFIYRNLLDPMMFASADATVSISEGLTHELGEKSSQKTRQKIHTIELFIDAKDLLERAQAEIETKIEEIANHPIIVTAGRLSPEKGFVHLIQVFKEVQERVPDAKLMIIGDGEEYHRLFSQCRELDLHAADFSGNIEDADVIFMGYRKDPFRYYRVADVFVLSSLTEGFSNSILEALGTGVSVMATDCPWGPRSILWDCPPNISDAYPTKRATKADYGWLMPRIDKKEFHSEWVEALVDILQERELDHRLTDYNQERLAAFDYHKVGEKWLKLIDEVGKSGK